MNSHRLAIAATALACGLAQATAADLPIAAKAPSAVVAGEGGFWIGAEFLYWSTKGDHLPPLVTGGTGLGVLGAPGTSILFGDASVGDDWRPGGRLRAGYWFDPGHKMGIEGHFFGLADTSTDFSASSTGTTLLARPFFNVGPNIPDSALVAGGPLHFTGQVSVNETSRLLGAGMVFRGELCGACAIGSVSGLIGYRYLHLRDDLRISSATQGVAFVPFSTAVSDEFEATNNFHGVDLGLTGEIRGGPWSVEWLAKAALGVNVADVSISGATTTTAFGATLSSVGGLLAQPTNIGNFSNSHFAVVPELALKLGYQVTPQWRVFVGYDALYWSNVQRAGGTIDTAVNVSQIGGFPLVGPARPAPQFTTTSFWAQGVTVGATFRY
jgi:Putative beta barrel porin-7 (BBP7)